MLRRATAEDHRQTEASFPLLSPDLTRETYGAALTRLHGIVAGWEQLAATQATPVVRALLPPRARRGALEEDLLALKAARSALWVPVHSSLPRTEPGWLGAMYVMEGSRLGGLYIAQNLEPRLHLQSGNGTTYLRGFGRETQKHWREFLAALEEAVPLRSSAKSILGARWMFAAFREWFAGHWSAAP